MNSFSKKAIASLTLLSISLCANAYTMPVIDPALIARKVQEYALDLQTYAATVFRTAEQAREHIESDAAVMATGLKSDIAKKGIKEDVAQYQQTEEDRREIVILSRAMEQAETTCTSLSAADAGPKIDISVKSAIAKKALSHINDFHTMVAVEKNGTTYNVPPTHLNRNAVQQIVRPYDYVMSNFCTESEAAMNRCGGNLAATKYPGGDMSPQYLFSDSAGNETMGADQYLPVDAFINHIVDSVPPEILRNPNWEATPEGQKYVLMVREYAAYMNLAKYSLQSIQLNHMPLS